MRISPETYKGSQGFLLVGFPFVLFFWLNGTLPFEFAVMSMILLSVALFFLKVEMVAFITITGIDSIHEHLKHHGVGVNEKSVLAKKVFKVTNEEEANEVLARIKAKLQEDWTDGKSE